ncbi:unnamed protein product [Staurois parvus]|uniref:Secreted protein n=1 Tax=Staurois parvus TaxID=386267 RepID=A0ABN9E9W6_9NEOB|nr:unnamed protein product [Staurois parvus]
MLAVYVCFTVSTLICMVLLLRAIQSSVQELTGEISVLFIHRSLPCWRYLAINRCWREITGLNLLIESGGCECPYPELQKSRLYVILRTRASL